ncbi:MAG: hypothetical protein H6912_01265 [Kordiimonadaceae bacterium]|nr:hypothetical protein [Kordiimonadaceae bacterium]
MQSLLALLGYINGRIGVKCSNCIRLKNGKCLGRQISAEEKKKKRVCGLWKKRYVWIKRHSKTQTDSHKLKHDYE